MASYTRLPSNRWRVLVRKQGHTLSRTFRLKVEAETWAAEQEKRVARGDPGGDRRQYQDAVAAGTATGGHRRRDHIDRGGGLASYPTEKNLRHSSSSNPHEFSRLR